MVGNMAYSTKPGFLTPFKALLIGLVLLGSVQRLSAESSLEDLIEKIPSKIEHGESGSTHYKLSSLKMNGVKHNDESGPPNENPWPPRPGRRSFVPNQWYMEPGSPRPGRRSLQDQNRVQRPRPGRAHIPQRPRPNPFGRGTRPGRNAEGDIPWEYTGNSLKTGQSKESHTLKQIAPQTKRDYQEDQLEIQRDFHL